MLALAALCLSILASIVVLEDGDASNSLDDHAAALLARLSDQANVAAVVALGVALVLAWALTLTVRARDRASARAHRLADELAATRVQMDGLRSTLGRRDDLLLTVVHELRTPLTHVVGYAELLSGDVRPWRPEEVGEMSAAIQAASTTMLRLMDDLVEATRAQIDGFNLKARPVDLVHLIRILVAGYDSQAETHRVTLAMPDHWLAVRADPERIHQVLGNLLTNAISYSPAGGEIAVRARAVGNRVRVEIEDHGIGIEPEDRARIFDRFFRAGSGRAVREHGSGLGLAVVKELVRAHGGEVGVSSRPGVGSTFWFTLPAADDRTVPTEALLPTTRPTARVHRT
jgi:two-component system, OmpR family, sensor histidine kinase BaeS